jgi:hypothetical protein
MKSVTTKKLNNKVKEFIAQIISEILSDPDFGLDLSQEAKEHLRKAGAYRDDNISASKIKEKYY